MTTLVPAAAVSFMWWASLPASSVGLVSLVMTARVAKLPAEQMTETIDYLEPAGTEEPGPGCWPPARRCVVCETARGGCVRGEEMRWRG